MRDELTKGDQSRAEIMAAARRLFLTQGYNGTSMRAIAREAGDRAVAGIYNHFATKEAIFRALVEEDNPYDDLLGIIESAQGTTAPDYIRHALRRIFEVMPRHHEFIQLVQIDMREFGGSHMQHVLRDMVFPRVMNIFYQLRSLPGLKPIDVIVLMRLMGSLVIGFIVTENLAPGLGIDVMPRAVWADMFIDALLGGIADQSTSEGQSNDESCS